MHVRILSRRVYWALLVLGVASFLAFTVIKYISAASTSWRVVGLQGANVLTLAVAPTTPETIYAVDYGENLLRSQDQGLTWQPITNTLQNLYIWELVVHPVSPTIIFAAGGSMEKSVNRGDTWITITNGLPVNMAARDLAVDPVNPQIMYAALSYDRVYKTIDGGDSWAPASTGIDASFVGAVAVHPLTQAVVYAGTLNGVYESVNSGDTWEIKDNGLSTRVLSLLVYPDEPSIVLAGTLGGIYRSDTGGDSWELVAGIGAIQDFLYDAGNGSIYAAAMTNGVWVSIDNGATWENTGSGLEGADVRAVAANPVQASYVYAGAYGQGVFSQGYQVYLPVIVRDPAE